MLRLDPKNRYALVNLQKLYEDQHQWPEALRVREQVATGACVQAAAAATSSEPADVADAWKLGAGDVVEPGPGTTGAGDVRAAYAALRAATADTPGP